jgi:NADP-dependent 3-hydroxy acid dehydrogenase YdfG
MAIEKRSLAGETIVITGASSGIGRAAAKALVEAGANVVLGARREDRLHELEAELGDRALAVASDVRDPEDSRRLIAAGVEKFGRVDSVVLAAGMGLYGGVEDYTDDEVAGMIDINLTGTVWGVRAALPEFRRNGGGDIVIIASVAGLRGGGNEAVYAATKFGQVGLAGAVDRQVREEGIRVTAICPAATSTEFALGTGRTEGDPSLDNYMTADDIAFQVLTVLEQPRRLRTTIWASWSMAQGA